MYYAGDVLLCTTVANLSDIRKNLLIYTDAGHLFLIQIFKIANVKYNILSPIS